MMHGQTQIKFTTILKHLDRKTCDVLTSIIYLTVSFCDSKSQFRQQTPAVSASRPY